LNKYAQVIVNIAGLGTKSFSYLIPDFLQDRIEIGLSVLVPFGNQQGVNGFIVGFNNELDEKIKAKYIIEILDAKPLFDKNYLEFLEWIANYYCCDLQSVIETAIPQNLFSKSRRNVTLEDNFACENLSLTQQKIVEILRQKPTTNVTSLQKILKLSQSKFYEELRGLKSNNIIKIETIIDSKISKPKIEKYIKIVNDTPPLEALTSRQREVISTLKALNKEIRLSELIETAKTTANTLKKLSSTGYIEIIDKKIYRNALKIFKDKPQEDFLTLTNYQKTAYEKIVQSINNKNPEPMMLYGITGSGKTEVYLHSIKYALEKGLSVIFLAPEILIASQLAKRIAARFGINQVALWHSNVSEGEKFDSWGKITTGEVKIVVGARSAIFAPVKNLGLIIIDEEHDSAYKQTSPNPRYNAKKLAAKRAKMTGAALLSGSATPDLVSFYKAQNADRIMFLPERFGTGELANITVIDMREEFNTGNRSIFSRALRHNLIKNMENKKQSILLINRRGFSTYAQCSNCGYTAECESCSIPLIFHKTTNALRCHYCNYETPAFSTCPQCGSHAVKYSGLGTQKVEEYFKKDFPKASVARIDSDIMSKKNAHIEIMEAFSNGEIEVLIGTQMVAKGIDIANVTLVGVLMADSLFNMPDFRAGERGFQLLTQVAGRAGRGDFKGKVFFQTYSPEFFAIQQAKEQNFLNFYDEEIKTRNELLYPPFSSLIRVIISSKNASVAEKFAEETAEKIKKNLISNQSEKTVEIRGPSPCVLSRLKDEFRFHIIIKNLSGDDGHLNITNFLKTVKSPADIKFLIDVDPSDML